MVLWALAEPAAGCTFVWGLRHEGVAKPAQAGVLLLLLILRVTFDVAVAAHSWQEEGENMSDKKPRHEKGSSLPNLRFPRNFTLNAKVTEDSKQTKQKK